MSRIEDDEVVLPIAAVGCDHCHRDHCVAVSLSVSIVRPNVGDCERGWDSVTVRAVWPQRSFCCQSDCDFECGFDCDRDAPMIVQWTHVGDREVDVVCCPLRRGVVVNLIAAACYDRLLVATRTSWTVVHD